MENYIIIIIIVAVFGIAVCSAKNHFKGQGGCCGGGSYKPKKKKLSNIHHQKIFKVDGMHCENCKNRVEEVVNDISGVAGKANLNKGELVVSYAEDVSDDTVKARIEKAGYKVTEIKDK